MLVIFLIAVAALFFIPAYEKKFSSSKPPKSVVDNALKELKLGEVAFESPMWMEFGDVHTVHLVVSKSLTREKILEMLPNQGEISGKKARLSGRMEAALHSSEFDVKSITPAEQLVGAEDATTWSWTIKPNALGSSALNLSLNAIAMVGEVEAKKSVGGFERHVYVKISTVRAAMAAAHAYWIQLTGGLSAIGAVVAWLVARKWPLKKN